MQTEPNSGETHSMLSEGRSGGRLGLEEPQRWDHLAGAATAEPFPPIPALMQSLRGHSSLISGSRISAPQNIGVDSN